MSKKGVTIKTKSRTGNISLPSEITTMKQSRVVTFMIHDYSLRQQRALIVLMENFQAALEDSINGVHLSQMDLFQTKKDLIAITIPISKFGIEPRHYPILRQLLIDMTSMPVVLDSTDPFTGKPTWRISGLIRYAHIPKDKYGKNITLEIDKEVVEKIIDVQRGFTKYVKEIALNAQSKYTLQIYLLISTWKDSGGFEITMKNFRKYIGLENIYPLYKNLNQRVLQVAYDELFENADCWFEVRAVYKDNETEPHKLKFKIVRSELTKKERDLLEQSKRQIGAMLSNHLFFNDKIITQTLSLIDIYNHSLSLTKVAELISYIKDARNKVASPEAYFIKSINKYIESIKESDKATT